jgi:arginine decarboxylase
VLDLAKETGIRPKLGIRVKLSSKGGGHWSSSGGVKSKFGLSIPELTVAVQRLDTAGYLDCVSLLHFHPGSQITNVRKIKSALIEVARVYVNLIEYGVPIKTIDVGGGLAVDYTGNRNKDKSSMNYTLREYANDVVYQIQTVCDATDTPHPNLYSESGRALVAHHSLLVVPVIGTSHTNLENSRGDTGRAIMGLIDRENEVNPNNHAPLKELTEIFEELTEKNLLESFHDAQAMIEMSLQMFSNGMFDIWHRAYAERMGWSICKKINSLLDELDFIPRELEQLRNMLADTYFGNFSLFQALPDAWAIKQLFPVMPIHRLNERPTTYGTLGDITCDSDGKIDCFVGDSGDRDSLALHPLNGEPYHIAIFLIGAYQEALSDDHNLMGKFHIATINDPDDPSTWGLELGSDLEDVLVHVHHDTNVTQQNISLLVKNAVTSGLLTAEEGQNNQAFFDELKNSYTYLRDDQE